LKSLAHTDNMFGTTLVFHFPRPNVFWAWFVWS